MHTNEEMSHIQKDLKDAVYEFKNKILQTKQEMVETEIDIDTEVSTDFDDKMVKELKDRIEMYQIKFLNEFNMSYKNHTLEEKIQFCIKNKARQEHILDQCRCISNQVEFLKQQNFDEPSIDNEEINISSTVLDGKVNYDILLNTSRMNLANMKNDEYNTGYFANDNNHRNFINVPEIKRGTRSSDFDLNKAFEEMRHKEILNKAPKEDISKSNTLKDIKSDPNEMYWELLDEEADSSSASEDAINENSKLNIKSLSENQLDRSGVKSSVNSHSTTLMK